MPPRTVKSTMTLKKLDNHKKYDEFPGLKEVDFESDGKTIKQKVFDTKLSDEVLLTDDINILKNALESQNDLLPTDKKYLHSRIHSLEEINARKEAIAHPSEVVIDGKAEKRILKTIPDANPGEVPNFEDTIKVDGYQINDNSCLSETMSLLVKSRGLDISSEVIRGFRQHVDKSKPRKDIAAKKRDYNRDAGVGIEHYAGIVNDLLPNTGIHTRTLGMFAGLNSTLEQIRRYEATLKQTLDEGLIKHKSPIVITGGSHYITVLKTGKKAGKEGFYYLDTFHWERKSRYSNVLDMKGEVEPRGPKDYNKIQFMTYDQYLMNKRFTGSITCMWVEDYKLDENKKCPLVDEYHLNYDVDTNKVSIPNGGDVNLENGKSITYSPDSNNVNTNHISIANPIPNPDLDNMFIVDDVYAPNTIFDAKECTKEELEKGTISEVAVNENDDIKTEGTKTEVPPVENKSEDISTSTTNTPGEGADTKEAYINRLHSAMADITEVGKAFDQMDLQDAGIFFRNGESEQWNERYMKLRSATEIIAELGSNEEYVGIKEEMLKEGFDVDSINARALKMTSVLAVAHRAHNAIADINSKRNSNADIKMPVDSRKLAKNALQAKYIMAYLSSIKENNRNSDRSLVDLLGDFQISRINSINSMTLGNEVAPRRREGARPVKSIIDEINLNGLSSMMDGLKPDAKDSQKHNIMMADGITSGRFFSIVNLKYNSESDRVSAKAYRSPVDRLNHLLDTDRMWRIIELYKAAEKSWIYSNLTPAEEMNRRMQFAETYESELQEIYNLLQSPEYEDKKGNKSKDKMLAALDNHGITDMMKDYRTVYMAKNANSVKEDTIGRTEYLNNMDSDAEKNFRNSEGVKKAVSGYHFISKSENMGALDINSQRKGLNDFHKWMYRNCDKEGLGEAFGSSGSSRPYVEYFMSLPYNTQIKALYLIENKMRHGKEMPTDEQLREYTPNLKNIKKQMLATWAKFWKRKDNSMYYWKKLKEATLKVQSAEAEAASAQNNNVQGDVAQTNSAQGDVAQINSAQSSAPKAPASAPASKVPNQVKGYVGEVAKLAWDTSLAGKALGNKDVQGYGVATQGGLNLVVGSMNLYQNTSSLVKNWVVYDKLDVAEKAYDIGGNVNSLAMSTAKVASGTSKFEVVQAGLKYAGLSAEGVSTFASQTFILSNILSGIKSIGTIITKLYRNCANKVSGFLSHAKETIDNKNPNAQAMKEQIDSLSKDNRTVRTLNNHKVGTSVVSLCEAGIGVAAGCGAAGMAYIAVGVAPIAYAISKKIQARGIRKAIDKQLYTDQAEKDALINQESVALRAKGDRYAGKYKDKFKNKILDDYTDRSKIKNILRNKMTRDNKCLNQFDLKNLIVNKVGNDIYEAMYEDPKSNDIPQEFSENIKKAAKNISAKAGGRKMKKGEFDKVKATKLVVKGL